MVLGFLDNPNFQWSAQNSIAFFYEYSEVLSALLIN